MGVHAVLRQMEQPVILAAVEHIWQSLLGVHLQPADLEVARLERDQFVYSRIRFTGAWGGIVEIKCSEKFAFQVASDMFATDPGALCAEEMHDAVGEIINQLAGRLKHALPHPCEFSLPSIHSEGVEDAPAGDTDHLLTLMEIGRDTDPFQVRVRGMPQQSQFLQESK